MARESLVPRSVSSFLQSYAPDSFEWESPGYCPRTSFLWSKPLTALPPGSHSKPSTNSDASVWDVQLSTDTDSLSDMSISMSDVSSEHFAALPPMNRARTASNSAGHRMIPVANASSLSDMSVSFPTAGYSSFALEDFDSFAANVPVQASCEPLLNATPPDDSVCSLLQDVEPRMRIPYVNNDDGSDGAAVGRILEWTTSLFATVASSVLDYSIQSGVDDLPIIGRSYASTSHLGLEDRTTTHFSSATKDMITDSWSPPSSPIIRLNPVLPTGPPRPIQANPLSILMPGAIDYEAINPEQSTTAKPVCMWGRRLERIPKVRLSGQKEAVYCFDARKQRQKQKASLTPSIRHAAGSFQTEEPTQIFYRARPLCTPFVRRDLPPTPVDAVKIAQGQVLLQNVSPVRFDPAPSPSFGGASQALQRLPLTPRTHGLAQNRQTGSVSPSLLMRKLPGPGFL